MLKRYGDRRGAVIRARGAHVPHSLDAINGLLKDGGDGGLNVFGVGADVVAADNNLRRSELRVKRNRQSRNADSAGQHNKKGADRSEDWATNKKVYKQR